MIPDSDAHLESDLRRHESEQIDVGRAHEAGMRASGAEFAALVEATMDFFDAYAVGWLLHAGEMPNKTDLEEVANQARDKVLEGWK